MADGLIGKLCKHGIAWETGTVGAGTVPTVGLPNFNKTDIAPNQTFVEDEKAVGLTVPTTQEVKDDTLDPEWSPETACWHPWLGAFLFLLTQNASESGAYIQSVEPDTAVGKVINYGDTIATNLRTVAVKELHGQSGSRNIVAGGGVVSRVDVNFGTAGIVKVTPTFKFMTYDVDQDSTGVFTHSGVTDEKRVRDWHYKLGDSPVPLYSKELTLNFIADVQPQRYGGLNDRFPYRWVYNGWTLEGKFFKPVVAGTDSQAKDFWVKGGEAAARDQLLYVYTSSIGDYNDTLDADGDMRFTLNIEPRDIDRVKDNELLEQVPFVGKQDGTNNIWLYEQFTTGSQAWAN